MNASNNASGHCVLGMCLMPMCKLIFIDKAFRNMELHVE